MQRKILHIDMDQFFAAVEQRERTYEKDIFLKEQLTTELNHVAEELELEFLPW